MREIEGDRKIAKGKRSGREREKKERENGVSE